MTIFLCSCDGDLCDSFQLIGLRILEYYDGDVFGFLFTGLICKVCLIIILTYIYIVNLIHTFFSFCVLVLVSDNVMIISHYYEQINITRVLVTQVALTLLL